MGDQEAAAQQTAIGIKLFGRTFALTGRSAVAFVLIVLSLFVACVACFALEKPESFRAILMSPLWISAALWIAMTAYWSAAAAGVARDRADGSRDPGRLDAAGRLGDALSGPQLERGLRELSGQAYDDYRGASWALIPFVF